MTTRDDYSKMSRWRSTASTWVDKATHFIYYHATEGEPKEARWVAGYEAAQLLRELLNAAELLVPLLNDDNEYQTAEFRKDTAELARRIRNKALFPKLANTTGRTPEEAEAFRQKARELAS